MRARNIVHESLGRRRSSPYAGFTLIEMTMTLAVIGLIATLSLPRSLIGGGTATSVRIKAFEIVALLRADRDAARRSGRAVMSFIDLADARIVSGSDNGQVILPARLLMRVSEQVRTGIRFEPDGSATGGEIVLARPNGMGLFSVRIDGMTSAIALARGARDDG